MNRLTYAAVLMICFSLAGCMMVVDERAVPKESNASYCQKQSL